MYNDSVLDSLEHMLQVCNIALMSPPERVIQYREKIGNPITESELVQLSVRAEQHEKAIAQLKGYAR